MNQRGLGLILRGAGPLFLAGFQVFLALGLAGFDFGLVGEGAAMTVPGVNKRGLRVV